MSVTITLASSPPVVSEDTFLLCHTCVFVAGIHLKNSQDECLMNNVGHGRLALSFPLLGSGDPFEKYLADFWGF